MDSKNSTYNSLSDDMRSQLGKQVVAILQNKAHYHDGLLDFNKHKYLIWEEKNINFSDILKYCKSKNEFGQSELILNFCSVINNIAGSLLHGSHLEYKKNEYKPEDNLMDEIVSSIVHANNPNGWYYRGKVSDSSRYFYGPMKLKDITVNKAYLAILDRCTSESFDLFDNKNYLNENINLVKLFRYLGNRILELGHESIDKMFNIIDEDSKMMNKDSSHLLKSINKCIIEPFLNNLKAINNKLYEMKDYINCENCDKNLLDEQLTSTADYINDVLNSGINAYLYYFNEYGEVPAFRKKAYSYDDAILEAKSAHIIKNSYKDRTKNIKYYRNALNEHYEKLGIDAKRKTNTDLRIDKHLFKDINYHNTQDY